MVCNEIENRCIFMPIVVTHHWKLVYCLSVKCKIHHIALAQWIQMRSIISIIKNNDIQTLEHSSLNILQWIIIIKCQGIWCIGVIYRYLVPESNAIVILYVAPPSFIQIDFLNHEVSVLMIALTETQDRKRSRESLCAS